MANPSDKSHSHGHGEHSELSETELRVRTLETLLSEKGYIERDAVSEIIETYETKIGPRNGAAVIAHAWSDEDFKALLLKDANAAIAAMGFGGRQGEHMVAVENTDKIHNIVVCTLCSCYPWSVLGLPPTWYKSAPYRSKVVIDPRGVLEDFGVTISEDVQIDVWDSTAEIRYLIIPQRPTGTAQFTREQLTSLVTRNSMIGTGLALHHEKVQK